MDSLPLRVLPLNQRESVEADTFGGVLSFVDTESLAYNSPFNLEGIPQRGEGVRMIVKN